MPLSIIAALSQNHVIGIENRLPWHLPADLKHFKSLTLGKPVMMGRKTYESIGKPLPERRNIIVSTNPHYSALGCEVMSSLDDALSLVSNEPEVMLIGGAQLFEQALSMADCMYLTIIHQDFAGDCFFPAWDSNQWKETAREDYDADEKNPYSYSFITLKRDAKN